MHERPAYDENGHEILIGSNTGKLTSSYGVLFNHPIMSESEPKKLFSQRFKNVESFRYICQQSGLTKDSICLSASERKDLHDIHVSGSCKEREFKVELGDTSRRISPLPFLEHNTTWKVVSVELNSKILQSAIPC